MWRGKPTRLGEHTWHLVVVFAVEVAAVGLGGSASPLLEEERDVGGSALVAEVADPGHLDRAGAGAALAADDQPVDASEVNLREGTEERSGADESRSGAEPGRGGRSGIAAPAEPE